MRPLLIIQFWNRRKGTPADFVGMIVIGFIYFHMRDWLRRIFPNMSSNLKDVITYTTVIILMFVLFIIDDEFFKNQI